MKAVICERFDGPEALRFGEFDAPSPGPDEVLVGVEAAGVSFMDRLLVSGLYQLKPPLPFVPGTDAAGRVLAVGDSVTGFKLGDRVVASAWHGAYAQKMVAKSWRCALLPDTVSAQTAATIPYAYLTAYYAMTERAALKPGESVLVTGAAGGAGLAALDVAKSLGAHVIAVIGGPEKADIVREYGADTVIVTAEEDLRTAIKSLTDGRGVDVAFETVGGDLFLTVGRLMAFGGRLMPIGFASGTIPALPMNLPLVKGYSVVGVFMGAWADAHRKEAAAMTARVIALTGEGRLKPHVDRVMPLAEAADAMALIAERKVRGRIVLSVPAG